MSEEEELEAMLAELNDGLEDIFEDLGIGKSTETNKDIEDIFAELGIGENSNLQLALNVEGEDTKGQEEIDEAIQASLVFSKGNLPPIQSVDTVEAIVSGFLEQYKAKLNSFLKTNEEETTTWIPFTDDLKNEFITMNNFRIQDCRGINNDCIVNSLLTCLSPTFRRLEGEFKDKVASYYRYEHLLPMYIEFIQSMEFSDSTGEERVRSIVGEISSGIYKYRKDSKKEKTDGYGGLPISAEVAAAFGILHGINVLIKENNSREPGAFTLLGPQPEAKTFIIIHNDHGIHYSSISDSSNNYFFPIDMIKGWIKETEKKQHKVNKTKCPFITDQVLVNNGNLYIVVNAENTDDNKRCKHVYIHELDGGDVNQYKRDIQNILLIKKFKEALSLPPVEVPDSNFDFDIEQAKVIELASLESGAERGLQELRERYTIFKKPYTTYNEVEVDTLTLPFIDINGKPGYTLANPSLTDKYGTPSTYAEFMKASSRGGSKRKSRFRKTRKKLSHPV